MNVYWYWPHQHRMPSALIRAATLPGDEVFVQALETYKGERLPINGEGYTLGRGLAGPQAHENHVSRLARSFRRSRARSSAIRSGEYDVAYIESIYFPTDWAALRLLRNRIPLVGMVHDVRPHEKQFPSAVESFMLARTYSVKSLDHMIVYHETLKGELCDEFDVAPDRVSVVRHPLHSADQRMPGWDSQRAQHHRVLFFGTLRANKGIDRLLAAVRLAGYGFKGELTIAGSGTARMVEAIRTWADGLGNVNLEFGQIPESRKRELFTQATCVVLPYTEFHSQSGVLADAYSHRVPLMVSDVGALGHSVRSDDTGIVVPPGNIEALAQALVDFTSTDSGDRLYEAALEKAASQSDYKVVGRDIRNVFSRVIESRNG